MFHKTSKLFVYYYQFLNLVNLIWYHSRLKWFKISNWLYFHKCFFFEDVFTPYICICMLIYCFLLTNHCVKPIFHRKIKLWFHLHAKNLFLDFRLQYICKRKTLRMHSLCTQNTLCEYNYATGVAEWFTHCATNLCDENSTGLSLWQKHTDLYLLP